ncbi:MAG TPA: hypothetical protein VE967_02325 [Gemmatimonadaceae bacterium]|nr:hypothetical protein [Gemmatimonadaceae bacterium]
MALNNRRAITLASIALLAACSQSLKLMKDDSAVVLGRQTITAPNPGQPGTFRVRHMYYGPGKDKRRIEYRDSITLTTKPVDVSPFASVPPAQTKARKSFWGFDMKAVPLNGRVWYPQGDGPFPLALVVHGNHDPEKFSDPGYAYLGELLASRGFIMVSVDENFINGLSGENDGRAWLLLKHLEAWRKWNDSVGSPFYHKVDMQNIALMGHSRGGEAAATAAAFNRLRYYPDDSKQRFNFNFSIKSVVAIAPADGQYKPAGQFTPLENVNYLIIHGSHDGDVSTAVGLRQYERVRFTDGKPWFKSMIFMYRANHGQWNTTWGNKDNGPRSGRTLDLRGLIDPEQQRQFAKVVISGFLEATLHDKREYVAMFRDHRTAGHWLPKTMYTTRFQESGYHALAEYDEDVDLTTGSGRGVTIAGDSLGQWRENVLPFRGRGNDNQNHGGVWLGWNSRVAGPDTTKLGKPASYALTIPDSLRSAWHVGANSAVYFSLAVTNTKPGPRSAPRDTTKKDTTKTTGKKKPEQPKAPKTPPPPKEKPDSTPIDLTVELVDAAGHTARVPLSRFGVPRRPLEVRVYRRDGRDTQRFASLSEMIPQTYVMPLSEFTAAAADFNPAALRTIRLVFDRTKAGTVVIEDIGVSTPLDPAFLSAMVPARSP